MASAHGSPAHLLGNSYKADVAKWLEEDCPGFDWGGFIVGDAPAEAKLLGKSAGVLAGIPFFNEVFSQLDCSVTWHITEGASFKPVAHCATVQGPARKVLLGERVALNTLARCSGIATQTAATVQRVRDASIAAGGRQPVVAGTRKTTPGFRRVEKYAIIVGGADPHRHDLSAMVMIKDNHGWLAAINRRQIETVGEISKVTKSPQSNGDRGSLAAAVRAAKAAGGFAVKVEVECSSAEMAAEAINSGADVVMLDNMTPTKVEEAVQWLRSEPRCQGRTFLVEVSGGLTDENIGAYVKAGVDILSTSSIHQGVKHVDFSLKIVH